MERTNIYLAEVLEEFPKVGTRLDPEGDRSNEGIGFLHRDKRWRICGKIGDGKSSTVWIARDLLEEGDGYALDFFHAAKSYWC